jgi:hypothetical protein
MGYTTVTQVKNLLAQTLTSATNVSGTTPVDLINIGTELDNSLITTNVINQYITWADDEINSAISELYRTPLCENGDFETVLAADIDEYNVAIVTEKACPFNPGDSVMLATASGNERHEIDEIVETNAFTTVDPILVDYPATTTRVVRIRYSDPIPFVATRLTVANVYDKYFSSQSDPNTSDYGKVLRSLASNMINDILNGRRILHGQHRIGIPFSSPYLQRRYSLPGSERYAQRDMEVPN